MFYLRTLGETLIARTPDIMSVWADITNKEPWLSLPVDQRPNGLSTVVQSVLDVALCHPGDLPARRAEVDAATEHGEQRRVQNFSPALLLIEYYLLHEAIRRSVVQVARPEMVVHSMARIDQAMTLASHASLQGYYHQEYEACGKWPAAIALLERSAGYLPVNPI